MNLRTYQTETVNALANKLTKSQRVLCVAPQGSGKTLLISEITRRIIAKSQTVKIIILSDRKELFTQARKTLAHFSIFPQLIYQNHNPDYSQQAFISLAETFHRRNPYCQFDFILIDEAHKRSFAKIIDRYPNAKIIGFTATPLSTSKKDPLKNYFDDIYISVQIPELIDDGHLVMERPVVIDQKNMNLNIRQGEFTPESQMKYFDTPKKYKGALKAYKKHAEGLKTLGFGVNREHIAKLSKEFQDAGYPADFVHGGFAKHKREAVVSWFRDTPGAIMFNCDLLHTGYDEPSIECILFERATTSLTLWLQAIGRGSRPSPGKTGFKVIDLGENYNRHGCFCEDRDWHELFWNPYRPGKTAMVAPMKNCPNCEAMIPAGSRICGFCGHRLPAPEKEEVEAETVEKPVERRELPGHLQKPLHAYTLEELEERRKIGKLIGEEKSYKVSWVVRQMFNSSKSTPEFERKLIDYMQLKNYKSSWVNKQLQLYDQIVWN